MRRRLGIDLYDGKVLVSRERLLPNVGRYMGLDIYVEAKKGEEAAGAAVPGAPSVPLAA